MKLKQCLGSFHKGASITETEVTDPVYGLHSFILAGVGQERGHKTGGQC